MADKKYDRHGFPIEQPKPEPPPPPPPPKKAPTVKKDKYSSYLSRKKK
jgi:hypothetical protein